MEIDAWMKDHLSVHTRMREFLSNHSYDHTDRVLIVAMKDY